LVENQRGKDEQERVENPEKELQRGAEVRIRNFSLKFYLAGAGAPDNCSEEVGNEEKEGADRSERLKRAPEDKPQGGHAEWRPSSAALFRGRV
jgi:hypothetical protein